MLFWSTRWVTAPTSAAWVKVQALFTRLHSKSKEAPPLLLQPRPTPTASWGPRNRHSPERGFQEPERDGGQRVARGEQLARCVLAPGQARTLTSNPLSPAFPRSFRRPPLFPAAATVRDAELELATAKGRAVFSASRFPQP
ncbi:hypothetical protein LEMLEM_LOCUS11238 [Lemmus lemmus]